MPKRPSQHQRETAKGSRAIIFYLGKEDYAAVAEAAEAQMRSCAGFVAYAAVQEAKRVNRERHQGQGGGSAKT